jgi:hypothetical protein
MICSSPLCLYKDDPLRVIEGNSLHMQSIHVGMFRHLRFLIPNSACPSPRLLGSCVAHPPLPLPIQAPRNSARWRRFVLLGTSWTQRHCSHFVPPSARFICRAPTSASSYWIPKCASTAGGRRSCNIPSSNPCNNVLGNDVILDLSQFQ